MGYASACSRSGTRRGGLAAPPHPEFESGSIVGCPIRPGERLHESVGRSNDTTTLRRDIVAGMSPLYSPIASLIQRLVSSCCDA